MTTAAYDDFVATNDLSAAIAELVAGVTEPGSAEPAAASVAGLFVTAPDTGSTRKGSRSPPSS